MNNFKEMYRGDIYRYGKNKIGRWTRKFHYYFRKVSTCKNSFLKFYYRLRYRLICQKHGIEISRTVLIGKGLYVGHPYNITINPDVKLGNNINIHKGVTIGQENRGKRKGVPCIGNNVWIGVNSTVVGKINIGDDVLIAPNAYVNCNIPSHSVVIGNPCKIIEKNNATEFYIENEIKSNN